MIWFGPIGLKVYRVQTKRFEFECAAEQLRHVVQRLEAKRSTSVYLLVVLREHGKGLDGQLLYDLRAILGMHVSIFSSPRVIASTVTSCVLSY